MPKVIQNENINKYLWPFMITQELLNNAMSYSFYSEHLHTLMNEGKTTGDNQSELYISYAKINLQRMSRIEKTMHLSESVINKANSLQNNYTWLAITEGWCGDAAQNLPVLNAIALSSNAITLKLILRDEHLEVMDNYLTHGARSIPKIICLETSTLKEVFVWGPRPAAGQTLALELKSKGATLEEKALAVQKWYINDKTLSTQLEFLDLMERFMY